MLKYAFESHEFCNDDQYVKEIVYFKFSVEKEGQIVETFIVPFFRKQAKDGGMFWSTASVGVQKHGRKEFVDGFMLDSRSRHKSLIAFLDERRWETNSTIPEPQSPKVQPIRQSASIFEPEPNLPF